MKLKDLTVEELQTLVDFGTTDYYKLLKRWIDGHKDHHLAELLLNIADSNSEFELNRDLYVRAGRFSEGRLLLRLPENAEKLLISIKKKKDDNKGSKESSKCREIPCNGSGIL